MLTLVNINSYLTSPDKYRIPSRHPILSIRCHADVAFSRDIRIVTGKEQSQGRSERAGSQ